MKSVTYKIYKATFPDGQCYIGMTKNSLNRRRLGHKYMLNRPEMCKSPFYTKMLELGFDCIKWEIISTFDNLIDAENEERLQIKNHEGVRLNILSGGMGTDNTNPELRKRVSQGLKGLKVSENTKEKLRAIGRELFKTEEARKAQSERMKAYYATPEGRAKYMKSRQTITDRGKWNTRNDKGQFNKKSNE